MMSNTSCASASVGCLVAMPAAKGLFRRAIFQSGVGRAALPETTDKAANGFLAKLGLDVFLMHRTRGHGMHLRHLVLAPIKDLLMAAIWPYSAVSRSVEWRGVKLKVGHMSKLSPITSRRERAAAAEAVSARRS